MNFKTAFYGQNNVFQSITDRLIHLCKTNGGTFIIPATDYFRDHLFGDPLLGVPKVIKFCPNDMIVDASHKIGVVLNEADNTLTVKTYADGSNDFDDIPKLYQEFKCFYGANEVYTDVTKDLVALACNTHFNVPISDVDRANMFGDPVYGLSKHLKLVDCADQNQIKIIHANHSLTIAKGTANTVWIVKPKLNSFVLETILQNVCYINLAHRIDRKTQFETQMKIIGMPFNSLTRVDAVYIPTQGALGCTKSHIKTLNLAIEKNWPVCAIFEDDFEWRNTHDLTNLAKTLESAWFNREKWDVLLLAGNLQKTEPMQSLPYLKKTFFSTTTSGYIVQRHYYEKLLKNFEDSANSLEKTGGIFGPYCLDVHWSQLMEQDNWFACHPYVGKQCDGFSDISATVRTNVDY